MWNACPVCRGITVQIAWNTHLILLGCANMTPGQRKEASARTAMDAGWERFTLSAGEFSLAGFAPLTLHQTEILYIYIEGDGLAWINASTPSFDPTPAHAIGLQLAIKDPSAQAVYLARPCQFVAGATCRTKYWTSHRFAPEVITATNAAIDQLKQRFQSKRIVLVGYSGGGAVAALVAARRKDVAVLLTVAGNLDTAAWTRREKLSPLTGSLNPVDAWRQLVSVPQVHFVGAQDKVVDKEIALSYRAAFPAGQQPNVIIIPGVDHQCCWIESWPQLWREAMTSQ